MNRLISTYITFAERFIPPQLKTNPLEYWRAHNVIHAALCAAIIGPLYAVWYLSVGIYLPAITIVACTVLTALSPFVLKYSGRLEVAQSTLLAGVYVCFTVLTYYFGGLRSPLTLWLLCCPVAAMFLGGRNVAVSWFGITMSTIVAFFLLDSNGWEYPVSSEAHSSLMWLIADVGLMALIVFYVYLYEVTKNHGFANLESALARIGELAKRDELTGSYNRRHVLSLIQEQSDLTKRVSDNFCIALLDLDFFKKINDTYGHVTGDAVLKQFSQTIQQQLRTTDVFGRYGGEEFLVLMPATRLVAAMLVAERIRIAVECIDFSHISPQLRTSVSIGVTQYHSGQTLTDLINCADTALYDAKNHGRNRVCAANIALEGAHVA